MKLMVWLRKSLVLFFAFILFISLLAGVWTIGFNRNFSEPDNIKTWLAESKIYDKAVSAVLNSSQEDADKTSGDGTISLRDPEIQKAAKEAFSPELLERSANTFIDANYAWLKGKTTKPEFKIDLSEAKEDFATKVGKYVETRLSGLPACTPAQQSQLQIPIDTLAVTCRPANLDPKTEGERVRSEISQGDFLSKPVITSDTFGRDENSKDKQPYYVELSKAPKLFQKANILPLVFGIAAIICALAVIVIAPERRRGWRKVGFVLLFAGVLLIASKFIAGNLADRLNDNSAKGTVTAQLQQPRDDLINHIQDQLLQTNLWFGIAFAVIAVAIFIYLIATREGRGKSKTSKPSNIIDEPAPTFDDPQSPKPKRPQPTTDIAPPGQRPAPTGPPKFKTPAAVQPKPRGPKPPRLIQ